MIPLNVNQLYLCPKDLIYQYLKQYVPRESIKLAFYKSCLDKFITKKTIWTSMDLLIPGGTLCVEVSFDNISDVISLCKQNSYRYDVLIFQNNKYKGREFNKFYNSGLYFVLIYREAVFVPNSPNILYLEHFENLYTSACTRICNNFSSCEDVLLLLGDTPLTLTPHLKKLCRHIIAFGDYKPFVKVASSEGLTLREVL